MLGKLKNFKFFGLSGKDAAFMQGVEFFLNLRINPQIIYELDLEQGQEKRLMITV